MQEQVEPVDWTFEGSVLQHHQLFPEVGRIVGRESQGQTKKDIEGSGLFGDELHGDLLFLLYYNWKRMFLQRHRVCGTSKPGSSIHSLAKTPRQAPFLTYIHSVNRGSFSAQSATLRDPNWEIGDGHPMSEHIEKAISTFLDGFS